MNHSATYLALKFLLVPISLISSLSIHVIAKSNSETSKFKTEFTDEEIINRVYDKNRNCPPNYDEQKYHNNSICYVSELHLYSPYEREGKSSLPLCIDDSLEAREWVVALFNNSSQKRNIEEVSETEKYFEFKTTLTGDPYLLFVRVDKCRYLNRTQTRIHTRYDSSALDTLGYFNLRPITPEKVEELFQHLYYPCPNQLNGVCVLSSNLQQQGEVITYSIFETSLTMGDYGIHDEITLISSIYHVNTKSGLIERSRRIVRTLKGKYYEPPNIEFGR